MIQTIKHLFFFPFLFLILTGCEGLEKTDMIRKEVLVEVAGKSLLYEMHLTGLDKYRYVYKLGGAKDTIQLFEAKFTDETANYVGMEFERTGTRLKIILDRPTEKQTKTVDGYTFELEGAKP